MPKLSEHFTYEEAIFSDTAVRNGISNEPNPTQLAAMMQAAKGMEQVRAMLGGKSITPGSWLRVEPLERIVARKDYEGWCVRKGYTTDSDSWALYFQRKSHPKGYAIDFTCGAFGTPKQIVAHLIKSGLKFSQLIEEGTWVHVDFSPDMRGEVLTAHFGASGQPTYTPGLT